MKTKKVCMQNQSHCTLFDLVRFSSLSLMNLHEQCSDILQSVINLILIKCLFSHGPKLFVLGYLLETRDPWATLFT